MTDKSNGSSEHSTGQPMDLAEGSNPSMASYNLRPTQRRAQKATALASANQPRQNQAISEDLASQLTSAVPKLQDDTRTALPGTPKASSTPAVAGMVRQTDFPNRPTGTPIPASRELDVMLTDSSRDVGSTSSTLTDATVVEVTKEQEDFENKTAGFIDDEVLLPTSEASASRATELQYDSSQPGSGLEDEPNIVQNVFEDEMFDFFMNQEAAVRPKEVDPATLFFSSGSTLSPSVSGEDNHSQADPMVSTMKANLSRIGQLMDSLAVRARIVSDSEVQNLRRDASLTGPLPKEPLSTKMTNQLQSAHVARTMPPTNVATNVTAQYQSQTNQGAVNALMQSSSSALAPDEQAAALAELRQTMGLLVDLVKKSQEHTNQTAAATKTDVDYLRTQFATIRQTQGHAERESKRLSEDISKVRQKVESKFSEFESRHREMREQQSEIRQQQTVIEQQQDELRTDVRTISTAVGGLANTIDENWKDMSDQNHLMQKTLLDQMKKLLSKTGER